MKTLEEFLEHECGMITPKLLKTFESHREFIETSLAEYNQYNDDSGWHIFSELIWHFLPEPKEEDFHP